MHGAHDETSLRSSAMRERTPHRPASRGGGRGNRGQRGAQRDSFGRSPQHGSNLLNFTYERPAHRQSVPGGRNHRGGHHGHQQQRRGGGQRRFRKADFLHANFRFVVSDRVDAQRYIERADETFDWADVLQVEVTSFEALQCPVTLETPPTVPVMTSCGHVFSLAAIVHCLLDSGGEHMTRAAKCPLCFAQVSARDLRLVTMRTLPRPDFTEPMKFVLLRRAKGSNLPQLADAKALPPMPHADAAAPLASQPFAKFVLSPDCLPAFQRAATALARQAAAVLTGGGLEAEIEGPSLFKAMDVLAELAKSWQQRKCTRAPGSSIVGAEESADDARALAEAERVDAAIRDVFKVELAAGEQAAEQAAQADEARRVSEARNAELAHLFPALGGNAGSTAPAALPAASGKAKCATAGAWGARSSALLGDAGDSSAPSASSTQATAVPYKPVATSAGTDGDSDEGGAMLFTLDEEASDVQPAGQRSPSLGPFVDAPDDGAGASADGISPRLGMAVPSAAEGHDETQGKHGSSEESGADMFGKSPHGGASINAMDDGAFFFYQAAGGAALYLHPINVRTLLQQHAAFAQCPAHITARVVEAEPLSQTEASRRRLQPLAHLPINAEFSLCEVDLAPLVSSSALQPFAEELAARTAKRERDAARHAAEAAAAAAAEAAEAQARQRPAIDLKSMPRLSEVRCCA